MLASCSELLEGLARARRVLFENWMSLVMHSLLALSGGTVARDGSLRSTNGVRGGLATSLLRVLLRS